MEASLFNLMEKKSGVMTALDRHEHVILTCRGEKRAIILPISERKKVKVAEFPACGMWADRDDMAEPVSYVENLRFAGTRFGFAAPTKNISVK